MIHLKAIHYSITPNHQRAFFNRTGQFQRKDLLRRPCKSNDSNSDSDATPPTPPQGDARQQELLARIAQLQTQKVRLTDYLDERSAYLSQFAEDANTEIEQVGENALKELDEAGARIMENIETRMQAFEESVELNKQEIEENEKKLSDFVDQMEEERNEGLFFKNLGQKQPVDKAKAKKETEKIEQLNKEIAESNTRKNIYLALMGFVVAGITNALIASPTDWGKSAVLGVILVGLLSQVILTLRISHPNQPNFVVRTSLLPLLSPSFFWLAEHCATDWISHFSKMRNHLLSRSKYIAHVQLKTRTILYRCDKLDLIVRLIIPALITEVGD